MNYENQIETPTLSAPGKPPISPLISQEPMDSGMLAHLKHWTGLDPAIIFAVMARFWSAMAGVVTLFLIAHFLTPLVQGYYYTFTSLMALQMVFELGFSLVVLQLAAHERAFLTFLPNGDVTGEAIPHARLASILQKSVRWYSAAAIIMACILLPVGWHFFATYQSSGATVAWQIPWCSLVLAVSVTFQTDPIFSFLEGCGFVSQVARMRLGQAVAGSLMAWTALVTHHGLFAPAMMFSGQAIVGLSFIFTVRRRQLFSLLRHTVGPYFVGWRSEIWPFQWRIAVSWMCGYLTYLIFTPVLFAFQGPTAAGQMGLSLNIASSLSSLAIAWMSTKASPFGNLIAQRNFALLDKLFFRTLWQSTAMLISCASIFFIVLIISTYKFPNLALRVLPPWAFALILLTAIINHIYFSEALYLRAHKSEPLLVQSVVAASLMCCITIPLAKFFGAGAVVIGYFLIGGPFTLTLGTYTFFKKRRLWHNDDAPVVADFEGANR